MSTSPKNWMEHVRKAVLLLLGTALGTRVAWELFAPAVPILVSLVVVLTVIWFALFGRHLHNNPEERKVLTVASMRQKTTVWGSVHRTARGSTSRPIASPVRQGGLKEMPKKGVRVVITGKPRPKIDVDAMTQIVIALGREFAERKRGKAPTKEARTKAVTP